MTATDQVQAAIAQAARLQGEAAVHKRNAEFHRREAQRKKIELAQFIDHCHELGITVVLEPERAFINVENRASTPTPQGGASGDHDREATRRPHSRDGSGQRT
jgi:hypothetical protein